MEDIDVLQLMEREQARRRAADAGHVWRLSRQVGGDVGAWCSTRRAALRVAAMVVLLALPAGWYMLLPQRVDDRQVLCNLKGDEALVVNRACSALGTCSAPAVARLWSDGGGTFQSSNGMTRSIR